MGIILLQNNVLVFSEGSKPSQVTTEETSRMAFLAFVEVNDMTLHIFGLADSDSC